MGINQKIMSRCVIKRLLSNKRITMSKFHGNYTEMQKCIISKTSW